MFRKKHKSRDKKEPELNLDASDEVELDKSKLEKAEPENSTQKKPNSQKSKSQKPDVKKTKPEDSKLEEAEDEKSEGEDSKSEEEEVEKLPLGQWILNELKFFSKLFVFILAFLTLVWGHFKIPSESMQPTLEVGDHIYVSKFAYGFSKHSLPLLLHKLPLPEGKIFSRLPKRGDVAVFRNPRSELVMIKRVVGLPGDQIQMKSGQLYINGELIARKKVEVRVYLDHKFKQQRRVDVYEQRLPESDDVFLIYEGSDSDWLDNTELFTVPDGHVFFMGDGRDNSIDSRALKNGPGMVPVEYLMGRADRILFSLKRCDRELEFYCPPKGRIMQKL